MIQLEELVAPFDQESGDWEDVLRRARRSGRPRTRLVLGAAVAAAALGGAPALAVLAERASGPELPRDRIAGRVVTVLDPGTRRVLLEAGRWRAHDGVCYLVPHVRAGCLLRGRRTTFVTALPLLTLGARAERGIRFRLRRPPTFSVVAQRGAVELVGPDGRVLAHARLGR